MTTLSNVYLSGKILRKKVLNLLQASGQQKGVIPIGDSNWMTKAEVGTGCARVTGQLVTYSLENTSRCTLLCSSTPNHNTNKSMGNSNFVLWKIKQSVPRLLFTVLSDLTHPSHLQATRPSPLQSRPQFLLQKLKSPSQLYSISDLTCLVECRLRFFYKRMIMRNGKEKRRK